MIIMSISVLKCLGEEAMQKPLWIIVLIRPQSEQPVSCASLIFYAVIVPVFAFLQPPFSFYPFRAICFLYAMQFPLVAEVHWWIVGHLHHYFYCFWLG